MVLYRKCEVKKIGIGHLSRRLYSQIRIVDPNSSGRYLSVIMHCPPFCAIVYYLFLVKCHLFTILSVMLYINTNDMLFEYNNIGCCADCIIIITESRTLLSNLSAATLTILEFVKQARRGSYTATHALAYYASCHAVSLNDTKKELPVLGDCHHGQAKHERCSI